MAELNFIQNGQAHGAVYAKLMANGFNVNALRTNDTLLYDEWKLIDKVVLQAAQQRLIGVADLQARGLTYGIPNGLSKTVLGYQDAGDVEDAQVDMDGINRGQRDRPEYSINYIPLPLTHYDFSFSAREIQVSRNGNMPLDTTMAALAARQVAEKVEEYLFIGSDDYTFGGGTIYGYLDAPQTNPVDMTADWATASGANILTDVQNMKQASINDWHYGPWIIYIPTAYETALDGDFKANSDKSIRERILQVAGVNEVKVADLMTAGNVIMVQMTSDVVRLIEGLPITTVQWDSEGGMKVNFKVMTIMVPHIRNDQNNRSGIVHLS